MSDSTSGPDPARVAGTADARGRTDGGGVAHVMMAGRWYAVDRTRCAACGRVILIASLGRRSALYDRIALDPIQGVLGERHACPGGRRGGEEGGHVRDDD